MCGIVGELTLGAPPPDRETLERMTGRIHHRGPDDGGVFVDEVVGLGSRRLAILDLTPAGHMPMVDAERGLVMVYNGEVYNSPELRAELEAKGERFRSRTDTEVVLKLLARDGAAALRRLRGMFALALWDTRSRRLLLARDGYGVKPLYVGRSPGRLLFASEPKGILAHPEFERRLSPAGVFDYFTLGIATTPNTMYEGIEKLPAGCYLEATPSGVGQPVTYFDPLDFVSDSGGSVTGGTMGSSTGNGPDEATLARELRVVLEDSVRRHLLADVPVGVFLSGGVDSAAMAVLLARAGVQDLQTFSVGFVGPRSMNELPEAGLVAASIGSRHHELLLTPEDLARSVLPLVRHLDEPPGDAACFPTWLLAQEARKSVKVVLTGEGGDEMFGGYRRYGADRFWRGYRSLRPIARPVLALGARLAPRVARLRRGIAALEVDDPAERGLAWQWALAPATVRELLGPAMADACGPDGGALASYRHWHDRAAHRLDRVSTLMYADQKLRMNDGYCEKVDRTTMAASLEARVPFIDYEVGRFAARVPGNLKVRGGRLKYLLRRSLEGIVPQEILHRGKRGFAVPLQNWFDGPLAGLLADVVRPESFARDGILRPDAVAKLLASRRQGGADALWLVLAFELWRREHFG